MTGHADGVITLDLREVDDVHREQMRDQLNEPYRTVLGHFRHEIGHFYQPSLMAGHEDEVRARFGDERADYQAALDRHYADGAPEGWEESFVSAYATMHPWEDWAETWAHGLHMCDTLETADNAALSSRTVGAQHDPAEFVGIEGATQVVVEAAVGRNALGILGTRSKPGLDGAAALIGQPAVGVRLELGIADLRLVAHFTSFSLAEGCPSIMLRSFSRARDSRDITVPIGMPSVRATSS
jgi:hypothetical protein